MPQNCAEEDFLEESHQHVFCERRQGKDYEFETTGHYVAEPILSESLRWDCTGSSTYHPLRFVITWIRGWDKLGPWLAGNAR